MSVVNGMANLIVLVAEMLAAFFKINCLSCEMSLILLVHDSHFTKYLKEYKRDAKYLNDMVFIILPWSDNKRMYKGANLKNYCE